uniref:Retrovirus-related Pol polyprotein from transposon TNT 1-94-like beta-barrel domain-containing protein n=1 Tax=Lactuca sativa TaxID=4236 RepID=A0A9R1VI42_LACSA|nr:hypothetical protein LSAT_V11C500256020 [Lactuca sativa]
MANHQAFIGTIMESPQINEEKECHNCQGQNHFAKACKMKTKKVKDEAYYLQKAEQIKKQSKDKAFMVMETPNMEVWETDDEVDQPEETEAYKNYFYFMAYDNKEPSLVHQQVVEKVHFMLRDNHLTIEPFHDDIDHITEIIKEYVTNVEYRVSYYKDELTDTHFKLEELRCQLLACDPSLFTGDNEDHEEVVTCSPDVIATSSSSIQLEVISSHDLPDSDTGSDSQVEFSLECPTMESFNSEDTTSEKLNIPNSKSSDKQPKSFESIGYSKTEPIEFLSQESFPSLTASVSGTKDLGCKYSKKQQTGKSPTPVNKDDTLKIMSNDKVVVEILKRPFVPIKISLPSPKPQDTIVNPTNVSKEKGKEKINVSKEQGPTVVHPSKPKVVKTTNNDKHRKTKRVPKAKQSQGFCVRVPHDDTWYIDSGCSRHMTEHKGYLRDFKITTPGQYVTFGNNMKGEVMGHGNISNKNFTVKRVAYVDGLKHNLISVT